MTGAATLHRRPATAVLLALFVCACDGAASREAGAQEPQSRRARAEARPATRGLDSVLVAHAFERAAGLPRLYSLTVARHGELVREEHFSGPGPNGRANIKSASKSIISALVGIAIAEGHLEGLDQPVAPFFPSLVGENADPRLRQITIGNLLSMQAGLEPTSGRNYGSWVTSSNWVRFALTRPFADDPGGRMQYSTGSTHLLSAILTRATGMSTLEYARTRLARPLGIELSAWARDPQGIYFGGNDMYLRTDDLLTFGEMYRNGGRHNGMQIVPEDWIRQSWTQRTSSRYNNHGYGLGWWLRRASGYDIYFAWGYGGQYIFIVPDLALTVVMTSDPVSPREGRHNRTLHQLVTDLLIPAAEQGSERRSASDPS
jgi:CubicO group peptidase (beta-lactamase class C family)